MDFEKLYSKLPNFIKYNRFVLDFFLKIPKKLDKLNKKSRINESHQQLFELMLVHSDFKAKGTLRNIQLLYVELSLPLLSSNDVFIFSILIKETRSL